MGIEAPDVDTCVDIVKRSINVPDAVLDATSVLQDVEGWDSLTMVHFVLAIKRQYGIALKPDDVRQMVTIADMATIIEKRRAL